MYDNPGGLIAGTVVMWLMTVLSVGLRIGSKIRERQKLLASDWLIIAGWIFGTGFRGGTHGFGSDPKIC